MTTDVFTWRMTAYGARSTILAFREELKDHHASQKPFPVSIILDLLPIQVDRRQELIDRGNFTLKGDNFENVAASELRVGVDDPTMKEYTIVIPADWKGTMTVSGQTIKLVFAPPLQLIIPRLEELGVNRTEYQSLQSMQADTSVAQSLFYDQTGAAVQTIIEVEFDPNAHREIPAAAKLATKVVELGGTQCSFNGDPGAADWYVYRRTGGLCVVHEGTIIEGGQLAYTMLYGPDTQDNCQQWADQHCPDGICP